jgi:hypothetical protein
MKKLFKVSFTDDYWSEDGCVYIISNGFDEAAEKALIIKEKEQDEIGILDEDGDLITGPPKPPRVRNVELLTENCYGIKDR